MEDGLVLAISNLMDIASYCLNPCCSGRWSRTTHYISYNKYEVIVLILVVVEDGLVPVFWHKRALVAMVLILVVVEDGLVRSVFLLLVSLL